MTQIFTVIVDKKKVNESDFYIMKMGKNAIGLKKVKLRKEK